MLIRGRYKHFIFDNFNYNHVKLLQCFVDDLHSTQISDWLDLQYLNDICRDLLLIFSQFVVTVAVT